ncbi:hypothetical protein L3V86_08110 [Thiotrichales bacterium 19S11-10]|nr:hypothetical protein [Thiotrichales bacterium 19S11-10]
MGESLSGIIYLTTMLVPSISLILYFLFLKSIFYLGRQLPVQSKIKTWIAFPAALPFMIYFLISLLVVMEVETSLALLSFLAILSFIGYIFMWALLVFIVPRALKRQLDSQLKAKSSMLFRLGFIMMVLPLTFNLPKISFVALFIFLILWIYYWIAVSRINKQLKWKA